MWAAVLGSTVTILLALFGVAAMVSGRFTGLAAKIDAVDQRVERHVSETMPATLKAAILEHQIKCPSNNGRAMGQTSPLGVTAMGDDQ